MITIDGKTGEVLQYEGSIAELQQGKSEARRCPACGGVGIVKTPDGMADGMCPLCEGSGIWVSVYPTDPIAALVKIGFQLLAGQLLNHTLKVAPGQLPAKPNRCKRRRRNR